MLVAVIDKAGDNMEMSVGHDLSGGAFVIHHYVNAIGVNAIFDGDGDRVGFVTNNGEAVRGDYIIALITGLLLKENAGRKIIYDVRSSHSAKKFIEENGGIPVRGKKVTVLGRSALVGIPTAEFLRQKGAEVSVCHSQTPNTKEITRASDIIVVAIGKPRHIGAEYFRGDKTQVVVDVGITAVTKSGMEKLEEEVPKRKLVGDVDFDIVKNIVAAISPVPGGVGPMTVAALFENLIEAYERQSRA